MEELAEEVVSGPADVIEVEDHPDEGGPEPEQAPEGEGDVGTREASPVVVPGDEGQPKTWLQSRSTSPRWRSWSWTEEWLRWSAPSPRTRAPPIATR